VKKLLIAVGAALLLLVGVVAARTARFTPVRPPAEAAEPAAVPEGAAERLAGSLRFATISHGDAGALDPEAFLGLHAYLREQFPRVHEALDRETVSEYSLLYRWGGSDPALKPILLMGHLDVVPVEPGTEQAWEHDPYGGRIADGYVWGRGALDNKSSVMGTLEAVEMLLAEGFRPARTVYLAYGHDEEVGGTAGAREIAGLLKSRGVELEMVLDEGGVIGEGLLAGLATPTAFIGIAEKGFVSVELVARAPGGHSSMPPRQSAVGIVSAAVARLEENPMPARLEGPVRQLFERIGPELPLAQRTVIANLWLTRPLMVRKLEGTPTTNAMVRTTAAATVIQGGTKDNVLPSHARAIVNFRILPGDSVAGVLQHVRATVRDPRVEARVANAFVSEPSAVSSTDSESYRMLERAIRSVAPEAIVTPYLVMGGTDARHYGELSENVYRFLPVRVGPDDMPRVHGTDERISVEDYGRAVRLYRELIVNAAGG
jgi:carboxypeptidase PM20D1